MQTLANLLAKLLLPSVIAILKNQEKMMEDLSKLTAAVSKLVSDFSTLATDIKAYLAANPPADPAQQAKVDALTQQLTDMDASAQAIDASLKPPAGGGGQP